MATGPLWKSYQEEERNHMCAAKKVEGGLNEKLQAIYLEHRGALPGYAWENEGERWIELLVSSLTAGMHLHADLASHVLSILEALNLTAPSSLAGASEEDKALMLAVFLRCGVEAERSARAVFLLCHLGASVEALWGGHVHRLLRRFTSPLIREISLLFEGSGLDKQECEGASLRWLQNTVNLPGLAGEAPHVKAFQQECKVTEAELLKAADAMLLNTTLLDDLLLLHHRASTSPRKRNSKSVKGRAKAAQA
jgi:hypothetical protein